MNQDLLIRNARPWGRAAADISIRNGVIEAIMAHDQGRADHPDDLDGGGRILLPSFTDAHVHLDSSRIGLPFRPHSATGSSLWDFISNDRENWREAGASVAERASTTLGRAIAHGMTAARSYAQVDADCGLERLEGVLAARTEHAARARVQVVAFPQAGLFGEPGVPDLMDAAMRAGADVVGGIDPCNLDGDPAAHLNTVFDLAQRHDAPIDVHLHEPGELGLFSIRLILERIRSHGLRSRVTIAHAFTLGDSPPEAVREVLDQLAEWDVALTTIAPGGRSGLPLTELATRGIRTGLGQDGQRDYWSPYGNTDMLERTWQLAFTSRFRADDLIEHCLAIATTGGRAVIDVDHPTLDSTLDRPGVSVGDTADLVLIHGETPTSAVMDRMGGRTVLHAGRIVADDGHLLG